MDFSPAEIARAYSDTAQKLESEKAQNTGTDGRVSVTARQYDELVGALTQLAEGIEQMGRVLGELDSKNRLVVQLQREEKVHLELVAEAAKLGSELQDAHSEVVQLRQRVADTETALVATRNSLAVIVSAAITSGPTPPDPVAQAKADIDGVVHVIVPGLKISIEAVIANAQPIWDMSRLADYRHESFLQECHGAGDARSAYLFLYFIKTLLVALATSATRASPAWDFRLTKNMAMIMMCIMACTQGQGFISPYALMIMLVVRSVCQSCLADDLIGGALPGGCASSTLRKVLLNYADYWKKKITISRQLGSIIIAFNNIGFYKEGTYSISGLLSNPVTCMMECYYSKWGVDERGRQLQYMVEHSPAQFKALSEIEEGYYKLNAIAKDDFYMTGQNYFDAEAYHYVAERMITLSPELDEMRKTRAAGGQVADLDEAMEAAKPLVDAIKMSECTGCNKQYRENKTCAPCTDCGGRKYKYIGPPKEKKSANLQFREQASPRVSPVVIREVYLDGNNVHSERLVDLEKYVKIHEDAEKSGNLAGCDFGESYINQTNFDSNYRPKMHLTRQQLAPLMINPSGEENLYLIYVHIIELCKVGGDGLQWIYISSDAGATSSAVIKANNFPIHLVLSGGHLRFKTLRQLTKLAWVAGLDELVAALGMSSIKQRDFILACKNIHKGTELLMQIVRMAWTDDFIVQYWKLHHLVAPLDGRGDSEKDAAFNVEDFFNYLADSQGDLTWQSNVKFLFELLPRFAVQINSEKNEHHFSWYASVRDLSWMNHVLGNTNYARAELEDFLTDARCTDEVRLERGKIAFNQGQTLDLNTEQSVRDVKAGITSRTPNGFLVGSALNDLMSGPDGIRANAFKCTNRTQRVGRFEEEETADSAMERAWKEDNLWYAKSRKFFVQHKTNIVDPARTSFKSFTGKRTNLRDVDLMALEKEGRAVQADKAAKLKADKDFTCNTAKQLFADGKALVEDNKKEEEDLDLKNPEQVDG